MRTFLRLSFAVCCLTVTPAAKAECVERRIHEEVRALQQKAWLGGDLSSYGADPHGAVRIAHLCPGSPLRAAGAAVGDTVLEINGARVRLTGDSVPEPEASGVAHSGLQIGQPAILRLSREGRDIELQVSPDRLRLPDVPEALGLLLLRRDPSGDCLDQKVQELLATLREKPYWGLREFRLLERPEGSEWTVIRLYPGGPLEVAGVREGDVILAIDGIDIASMQFRRAKVAIQQIFAAIEAGRPFPVKIRRGDGTLELEATLEPLEGYALAQVLGARLLEHAGIFYHSTRMPGAPEPAVQ